MKVVALLTDAYGGLGGIAKVNRDLLEALSRHPAVSGVVAIPRRIESAPEPIPSGIDFRVRAASSAAAYLTEAARSVGTSGLGLVVCGHINLAPAAWALAVARRVPSLLVIHGIEAWTPSRRSLANAAAGRMGAVVAVSRFTLERFSSWARPGPPARFVVPNAVDTSRFAPGPKSPDLEALWGLTGRLVLLTLGRLETTERAKGFDQVFAVLPRLIQERPEVTYVIAGEGNDRPRLEAEAARLGIRDRVVFTGQIPEERKADLFRTADLYVMPSRGEGFGLVYHEALASGRPVVGSAIDGSRDALLDGALGELVQPDDPEDVLRGIRAALRRPRGVVPPELASFSPEAYRRRIHEVVDAVCARTEA